jgi:DNA-binding MurR/RpiR family transcriptional regulator
MPTTIHIVVVTPSAMSKLTELAWCNLCKRVPPKSFVRPQPFESPGLHPVLLVIETRKDFAVHVSLSSL